ncbi:thiamine diphosphate-binding protein [Fomitopsis serialis]|uniref:thiamine diphosphate-binding protein n=1 Tax=Fomitopsis serialis TaxID=139415 RepID=UPI002008BBCA|nr:thiamine diphosphate-binding protein [Neoantrodia serialis]KAH9915077.1 thiamine diphosphate-binding protein [Neoantrodia serialis]
MYNTATVFWKTLADAGVTHAFVNWGSDHSALLEDLERQRVEEGKSLLEIVTCPNEMVALCAAHGYSQVAGLPAAVIVHVDVGTQALASAVHNVDRGQTPVLIFAGASPFTIEGELKGSRTEWPLWIQDIPDQAAIVRQYMRYTAQISSGVSAAKTIMRALQFAQSDPKGPVYLWARRETLEEELDASIVQQGVDVASWPPITPPGLAPSAVDTIVSALIHAEFPLIITGNVGRNPNAVPLLSSLSNTLSVAIVTSCPSALCIPHSHPFLVGSSWDGRTAFLKDADVVVILEADIPWMPVTGTRPKRGARVFVIDADPLKQSVGYTHVDAEMVCKTDAEVALGQLLEAAGRKLDEPSRAIVAGRAQRLESLHTAWTTDLDTAERALTPGTTLPTIPYLLGALRSAVHEHTPSKGQTVLWLNEGISNAGFIWNHIQPNAPGSMLMSGGSSLGYALGGAIGAHMGSVVAQKQYDIIVAIVGDGDFLFGAPSTAYWIASRYETPFLTIVLNNGGWLSPGRSMTVVHPRGHGAKASGQRLTTSFGPKPPNYSQIAVAAGDAWGRRVEGASDLPVAFSEAIRVVLEEKKCAVVDCVLESI